MRRTLAHSVLATTRLATTRLATTGLAAAGLAVAGLAASLAGCGGSAGSAGPSAASPQATTSHPAGTSLAASPYKFSVESCGPLSAAQRSTFSTSSRLGAIVKVTNVSGPAASVQFTVAFRNGSQAHGQSYTGNNATALAKGKSELLEADMGPSVGGGRDGDTCTITKETLISPETLTTLATYSG
jgi:hypothetical protein